MGAPKGNRNAAGKRKSGVSIYDRFKSKPKKIKNRDLFKIRQIQEMMANERKMRNKSQQERHDRQNKTAKHWERAHGKGSTPADY